MVICSGLLLPLLLRLRIISGPLLGAGLALADGVVLEAGLAPLLPPVLRFTMISGPLLEAGAVLGTACGFAAF